jgi:hypothetical protein
VVGKEQIKMQKQHCDICGKETFINPAVEKVFETKMMDIPYQEAGVDKTMQVEQKVPVLVDLMRMDHKTGEIRAIKVQKVNELEERAIFLRLDVGDEYVTRDLCRSCVETVRPLFGPLWDKMASIIPKDA